MPLHIRAPRLARSCPKPFLGVTAGGASSLAGGLIFVFASRHDDVRRGAIPLPSLRKDRDNGRYPHRSSSLRTPGAAGHSHRPSPLHHYRPIDRDDRWPRVSRRSGHEGKWPYRPARRKGGRAGHGARGEVRGRQRQGRLDLTAAGCRAQDDGSRDHGTDQSYSQKRHRAAAARATGYRRQRNRYRRPYNRSPRPCRRRKADGDCLGHFGRRLNT